MTSAITVADTPRGQLRSHQRLVRQSLELLATAAQICPGWYVALSGGKDSTVVLDLARQVWPTIVAVWADDEWVLPETGDYIDRLRAAGIAIHQVKRARSHTDWFRCHVDHEGEPGSKAYAHAHGWTGCVLGVRADESRARHQRLQALGSLQRVTGNRQHQVYPLAPWSVDDVWAYIASRGLDYNRAYDRLASVGVTRRHQRIGPYAVDSVLSRGQIAILKRGWPGEFNRFAAAYPEARQYA